MTTAPNTWPLDRLVEQAEQLLMTALASGEWLPVGELQAFIPDDMADACLKRLNETVYKDQPDHREFGRLYLVREVVKKLHSKSQVEKRTAAGGKEEVRLDPSLVPPVSKSPAPSTKSANAPELARRSHGQASPEGGLGKRPDTPPAANESMPSPAAAPVEPMPAMPDAENPDKANVNSFQDTDVQLVEPDLPIHELANLIHETCPEDYDRIKEDIRVNGQQVPAWLHDGKLLDGRTRQKAAKELGRKLAVQKWQGPGSAVAFVVSLNVHRRHLDESQRAMVAAKIKPLYEEEARAAESRRQSTGPSGRFARRSVARPGGRDHERQPAQRRDGERS